MQIAELATKFSFTGSLKPLDNLNHGLTSAIGNIAKVTSVFTVAGVALNGFLAHTLSNVDAQVQLSRETGVSIQTLQELGYVASVNGSTAQAMAKTIDNLSKKIGEAAIQGSADFSRLGISVRDASGKVKDAETIFYEVRDAMQAMGLTTQEQKNMMSRLGIDESLLQTMQLTSSEMDKLRNKARLLGTITKEDGDQVVAFNDSLTTLKYGLDVVQKRLAIAFAPQLKDVADGFTDMLVANKDMIQNGLKKFFELVNSGLGAIFRFGRLLYRLIDGTIGMENALIGAGAAMLYLNRAMLMNPVGAIIAGVSALILVYDDLMTGIEGGQSVIADWFKEWFNIDVIGLIGDIKDAFSTMIDYVSNAFHVVFDPIVEMFDTLSNFEMPSLGDLNPFSGDDNDKGGGWSWSDLNPFSDNDPKTMVAPAVATSSTSTQTNNITIEVKSDNPQLAGQHVATELQTMLNTANVQFDRGGR